MSCQALDPVLLKQIPEAIHWVAAVADREDLELVGHGVHDDRIPGLGAAM